MTETVQEVTTPQFVTLRNEFTREIDNLAMACQEQFAEILTELHKIKEDVAVIKDIVKDQSFRIAHLEHKVS